LDYLVRDSHECGVPYGRVIDFPRLLRTLTVVYYRENEGLLIGLGIHEKGRVAAECVAFARYAMFSQVYWHHTARAAKAMLHRSVWEWLEDDPNDNDTRKTEFHQFLLSLGRPKSAQQSLFESPQSLNQGSSEVFRDRGWSQVHPGDLAVLQWIREKTSPDGQLMLEDLLARRIYKRLAVISESRNPALWSKLQSIQKHGYAAMLQLSRSLQDRLRTASDKARKGGAQLTSTAGDADAVVEAIAALGARATILVDIPSARTAEEEVLRYLPEVHHREQKEEFTHPPKMEDSPAWKLLGERVYSIAGKVRVFAHPTVVVLARTLLNPEFVEAQLIDATKEVIDSF
jgi:hypothetical protein